MEVLQADIQQLEDLAQLFDQYRQFYNCASGYEAAKQFLRERFEQGNSILFLAKLDGHSVGFTQLYPSFSSISMQPIWILNDLFVDPHYRGKGVAKLLMSTAENFTRNTGAIRITLATQMTNRVAQSLYESRGYVRDTEFYPYALELR